MSIDSLRLTTPTLTSTSFNNTTTAQSTTRSSGPVDTFSAGTTDGGAAARQATVDELLASLKSMRAPAPGEGAFEQDVHEWMSEADLAIERQPYDDQIRALANQQPPLSPDQMKEAAKAIQDEWKDALGIIKGILEISISMIMFLQTQMQSNVASM